MSIVRLSESSDHPRWEGMVHVAVGVKRLTDSLMLIPR